MKFEEQLLLQLKEDLEIDTIITFTDEADVQVEIFRIDNEETIATGFGSDVESALCEALINCFKTCINIH